MIFKIIAVCFLQVIVINAVDEPNGAQCNGKRQSPIDISTRFLTATRFPGLVFNREYKQIPSSQQMTSDKHTIVITSNFSNTRIVTRNSQPEISGGPLSAEHALHSIHFHWGDNNRIGSEHLINGKSYPMEMHAVHTKRGLPLEEALLIKDGIVVIAHFIDIDWYKTYQRTPFSIIVDTIKTLPAPLQTVKMLKPFAIAQLVVPFDYEYITYQGSLTTNDCNEVVTWIIAPKILKITPKQMQVFRDLYKKNLVDDANNFRSPQPINGRKILFAKRQSWSNWDWQ